MCSQRQSVSQRIKLLCRTQSSRGIHLAFADHMHKFNISEGCGSRPERLEPHKSHLTLDRAGILFSDVVGVLALLCFTLCVVLLPLSAVRRRNVTRCRLPLRKADGEASLAHGLRD